ncbi:hypothetical protein NDU88_001913 [Pleurodeles waltl]|uniref:Uncharacterized protein n=1 Tax=Pleurodeles waltl TaxID=8319 RepID=A0AAV7LHD9_PLEWA|nr:hypothetical protein NDU88_001913 [Pleurodeles waltl]
MRTQADLQLLQEARRLDLVRDGAVQHLRPVQCAADGVAAVVLACSPPHAMTYKIKAVRGSEGGRRRAGNALVKKGGHGGHAPPEPSGRLAWLRTCRAVLRANGGGREATGTSRVGR